MTTNEADRSRREERVIAGRKVSVIVVPRIARPGGNVAYSVKSLATGMKVTGSYFVRPSTIVTRQYPENRAGLKFPARFRAQLRMIHDENGYHRCTGCGLCEKACPNLSIRIITRRNPVTNKLEIDHHIYRQDSCMVCNLCVLACPFDALEMSPEFESAVYDRRLLIYGLNRYAGPPASLLLKEPDPEARKKLMEPRGRYDGPVPLGGEAYRNVRPLSLNKGPGVRGQGSGSNPRFPSSEPRTAGGEPEDQG